MSIYKQSFFDYRSASQKKQDYEAYQKLLFPFGDAQRACVEQAFLGIPRKWPTHKLMFLFLVTKEKYLEKQMAGQSVQTCRAEALKPLRKWHFTPKENLTYLFALVLLDLQATSPEDYPSVREIYALRDQLFPQTLKTPHWAVLDGGRLCHGKTE